MQHPNIELCDIERLIPYANNARTHSDAQIKQIARSITRFDFTNPVLVGDDHQVLAGHGRIAAAKQLGMQSVPIIRLSHLSEAECRAYILADNKLAENAGWDRELLAIELQGLIDLDFDVDLIGFSTAEIDIALSFDGENAAADDSLDAQFAPHSTLPVAEFAYSAAQVCLSVSATQIQNTRHRQTFDPLCPSIHGAKTCFH